MRTRLEWHEELENLRELEQHIPPEGEGSDDHEGAIRAQINVIDTMMTTEDIYEMYGDDDFVLNAALDAERWMRHDDEPPSEYWRCEVLTLT